MRQVRKQDRLQSEGGFHAETRPASLPAMFRQRDKKFEERFIEYFDGVLPLVCFRPSALTLHVERTKITVPCFHPRKMGFNHESTSISIPHRRLGPR